MNLRDLPALKALAGRPGLSWEISARALDVWQPDIRAASADAGEAAVISILDVIGYDWWTDGGVTSARISAALRRIGNQPVEVHVNSPGGDVFEGIAIYSLLKEHSAKAKVTVKVLGLAASAASVIAMAGDEIQIARPAFMMIHNTWVVAGGNRHQLRDVADTLEPFDAALADLYVDRTGLEAKAIGKMMDKETWMGGSAAVDQGFADSLLASELLTTDDKAKAEVAPNIAARKMAAALQASGISRGDIRSLIKNLYGKPGAADEPATPSAGDTAEDDQVLARLRLAAAGLSLSTLN